MYPCLIGYEIEPAKWLEAGWFVTPRGMVLFPAKNYRRTIFVNARDPQRIKCFRLFLISFFPFYFSLFFYLNQLSAERKRLTLNAVPTLGLVGIALDVFDLLRGAEAC